MWTCSSWDQLVYRPDTTSVRVQVRIVMVFSEFMANTVGADLDSAHLTISYLWRFSRSHSNQLCSLNGKSVRHLRDARSRPQNVAVTHHGGDALCYRQPRSADPCAFKWVAGSHFSRQIQTQPCKRRHIAVTKLRISDTVVAGSRQTKQNYEMNFR